MVPGYPNMRTISHSFSPIPTITYSLSLQCDQIGRFLKVLGNKFSFKSSPKVFCDFWALLKNITFLVKSSMVNFWATFGTSWATFYFSIWSHCLSLSRSNFFYLYFFFPVHFSVFTLHSFFLLIFTHCTYSISFSDRPTQRHRMRGHTYTRSSIFSNGYTNTKSRMYT